MRRDVVLAGAVHEGIADEAYANRAANEAGYDHAVAVCEVMTEQDTDEQGPDERG